MKTKILVTLENGEQFVHIVNEKDLKVIARPGAQYELIDDSTGFGPRNIRLYRETASNDLRLGFLREEEEEEEENEKERNAGHEDSVQGAAAEESFGQVVFQDYFLHDDSISLVAKGEDGLLYNYYPQVQNAESELTNGALFSGEGLVYELSVAGMAGNEPARFASLDLSSMDVTQGFSGAETEEPSAPDNSFFSSGFGSFIGFAGSSVALAALVHNRKEDDPAISGTVSGTVSAMGPLVKNSGLMVELYQKDGKTLLGSAVVDDAGAYSIDTGSYTGVVIAKVVDTNGLRADFTSDVTGEGADLKGPLTAVGVASGKGTLLLNINLFTSVAAHISGVVFDKYDDGQIPNKGVTVTIEDVWPELGTVETVNTANEIVAKAFVKVRGDITHQPVTSVLSGKEQTSYDTSHHMGALIAVFDLWTQTFPNDTRPMSKLVQDMISRWLKPLPGTPLSEVAEEIDWYRIGDILFFSPEGLREQLSRLYEDIETARSQGLTLDLSNTVLEDRQMNESEMSKEVTLRGKLPADTTALRILIDNNPLTAKVTLNNDDATWSATFLSNDLRLEEDDRAYPYQLTIEATIRDIDEPVSLHIPYVSDIQDDWPIGVTLNNQQQIAENEDTTSRVWVADAKLIDLDGGDNSIYNWAVVGKDSDKFEIDPDGKLFLKAGVQLDYETQSSYSITVGAQRGTSTKWVDIERKAFTLKIIEDVNEAPTATGTIADQTVDEGSGWSLDISAFFTDQDANDTLTYHLSDGVLPAGVSINSSTGVISGTPTASMPSESFTVVATDSGSLEATQSFNLAVL